jgi:hemolysin III
MVRWNYAASAPEAPQVTAIPKNTAVYHGERFNGYSHLVGALLALGGTVALVKSAAAPQDAWRTASFAIYGTTLVFLFFVSTLYHSARGPAKNVLRKLDHCAIYLLIAGTWTPFTLVTLKGPLGWTLFAVVWALAFVGIAQECWIARGRRLTSLAIYVLMGWLGVFFAAPLLQAIAWDGFALLAGGGLIYTLGILFYLYDEKFPHWHGIWHLFVLAGSAAHYAAILLYVA